MRLWHILLCFTVPSLTLGQPGWVKINKPTTRNLARVSFIDSVRGWVAGDSGGVYRTTTGGQTWEAQDTKITDNILDLFVLNQSYAWAVAIHFMQDSSWYGTVFLRTTNGGARWTSKNLQGEYFYTVAFLDSVNGWMAGVSGKIRRTTDGGNTWTPAVVESSVVSGFPIKHLDFYSRYYGYGVGGSFDAAGVMWRTTNAGDLWVAYDPGGVGEPLNATHFIDSLNVMAIGGDFDVGSGIVRSKDGGLTWEYVYLGIWGEARAISFRTPGEGYVSLGFPGTYMVTRDTGSTWHDFPTPDTTAVFDVKFPDSLHGYMVGAHGAVLKYDPTSAGVNAAPPDLPSTTYLFQNFPNPFNPDTRITYHLAETSIVDLTVYDVLGRQVATLFHGREGPGHYEVEFNGERFASGVYYYELATTGAHDRVTQVRKMLLVK